MSIRTLEHTVKGIGVIVAVLLALTVALIQPWAATGSFSPDQ